MKTHCTILATAIAAALSASAKTFDWPIDAPTAGARQFTAYHGETVRFNLQFRGAMTNLTPVAIYYQTNGMGKAEWFEPVPGTVFHPTNDCGAAFYRFFIRCTDPDGVNYTANGSLRLLDSPGFEPSTVQLPVKTLDFSKIEVLNPPWGEGGGDPGNYAAVSNAAMNALSRAEAEAGFTEWVCVPATYNGKRLYVLDEQPPQGNWAIYEEGKIYSISNVHTAPGATNLYWSDGWDYMPMEFTATRTRLPTMADLDGLASLDSLGAYAPTNDVALTPVYSQTPTFSEWAYTDPQGNDITSDVNERDEGLYYDPNGYPPGWYLGYNTIGYVGDFPQDATLITWDYPDTYTATRTRQDIIGYTLGSETNKVLSSTNGLASASVLADIAATVVTNTADIATVGAQVNAIGAHINAEDAHFVSTNYDSSVRLPEAYVEIKMRDQATGSNTWITIWQEMRRWTAFVGAAFDWAAWGGFHAWATNVTAELSFKADRCWGVYDSETGGYSPDGYLQISTPNIIVAKDMAYQRTVTSDGAVWVLQCNQGVAHIGGDTNGFFRVTDGDGVTQFEIVKGGRLELGCDADGITLSGSSILIPYSIDADEHPKLYCGNDLSTWKAEDDSDCLCTVSWSGERGAWVATATPKTPQVTMFFKGTYMAGGETYIRNTAPVSVGGGILCTDGVHKCRPVYSNGSITWEVVQ